MTPKATPMAGLLKADDSGTMRLGHHIAALALAGMFAGCAWILFSFSPFGFWSSRLPSAAVFGLILSAGVRAISNRGDGVARISTPLPSQSGPVAFGLGALGFGLGVTLCGLALLPQDERQHVMLLDDGRRLPYVHFQEMRPDLVVLFKTRSPDETGLRVRRKRIVGQIRIDPREEGLSSLGMSALVGLCGGATQLRLLRLTQYPRASATLSGSG